MIILGYIGDHKKDEIHVRLGWWFTRLVQTGPHKRITHTESVLKGDNYKLCTIASSSVRDGGVRIKERITLTKGHWIAIDVPVWDYWLAVAWFDVHTGAKYDWLGAIGSILFFVRGSKGKWFCNEATGAPYIQTPEQYTPSKFWAIAMSMPGARDVTDDFFSD